MNDEMQQIERQLAYEAARSDIECSCERHKYSGNFAGHWYDVGYVAEWRDEISKATKYLEHKKYLRRHPKKTNMVQFVHDIDWKPA